MKRRRDKGLLVLLLALFMLCLAATPALAANAVTNLQVQGTAADSITLSWDYEGDPVYEYIVLRSTSNEPGSYIDLQNGSTDKFYTDYDVLPGFTYYYKVAAVDGGGTGAEAGPVSGAVSTGLIETLPTYTHLVIHKYILNDVDSANLSLGTGHQNDNSNLPAGATPLAGVNFTITLVELKDGVSATTGFDATDTNNYQVVPVSDSDSTPLFQEIITTNGNGMAQTSGNGLARGYYLIQEQVSYPIEQGMADFILVIPFANPLYGNTDEPQYLSEVHIYPKNQSQLPLAKFIGIIGRSHGTIANDGLGSAKWIIQASIPSDINSADSSNANIKASGLIISDPLPEVLAYQPGSLQVVQLADSNAALYLDDTTLNGTVVAASNYNIDTTGNQLTISFIPDSNGGYSYLNADYLRIIYQTSLVADKIAQYAHQPISTDAQLSYKRKNYSSNVETTIGTWSLAAEQQPEIHYGSIDIYKYILESVSNSYQFGAPLAGVSFKIAASYADAMAGNYLPALTGSSSGGQMVATTAINNGQAVASFQYLAYHDGHVYNDTNANGSISYWISEVETPSGYQLLLEPIEVKISLLFLTDEQDLSSTTVDADDGAGTAYTLVQIGSAQVGNMAGWNLPKTGGIGTIILTVAGIVALGLAILAIVTRKKKRSSPQ